MRHALLTLTALAALAATAAAGPILDVHLGNQGAIAYDGSPAGALTGTGLDVLSYDTGAGSPLVTPSGWTVSFTTGAHTSSPLVDSAAFAPGGSFFIKDSAANPLISGAFKGTTFVVGVGDGFGIVATAFSGIVNQSFAGFLAGQTINGSFSENFQMTGGLGTGFNSTSIGSGDIQATTTTPEPATLVMAAAGAGAFALASALRRRKRVA
jgi:hypothetical protein